MKSDFLYPTLADRNPIDVWETQGAQDFQKNAEKIASNLLKDATPSKISNEAEIEIRRQFDIHLPVQEDQ